MENIRAAAISGIIIEDIAFAAMCIAVFIFNWSSETVLGLTGNNITNILIILFMGSVGLGLIKNRYMPWQRTYSFALVFAFLCLVSCLYSYDIGNSFSRTGTMFIVAAMSVCLYVYIVLADRLTYVLNIYIWSGTVCSIYILYNSGGLFGQRIGEEVGDPNQTAITLAMAFTIALFYFIKNHRIYRIFQMVVMGLVIISTGSRTASLIMFVAIVVVVYASAITNHWRARTVVLVSIVLIIALSLLLYAVFNVPFLYESLGIRIVSFIQIQSGQHSITNESSTQFREIYARRALSGFSQSPIWGNGIDAFASYNATFADGRNTFSHCNYTEILYSLGILGFISYYGIFIYNLKQCVVKNFRSPYKALAISLIIEYLVGDIGLVVYYQKITWILIAIIAGLVTTIRSEAITE